MPNEPVCRLARANDYKEVVSMGDMFFGADYLPHFYSNLFTRSHFYSYVCELDGKVVGFLYFHLIDSGTALYSGGIRVHHHHRHKMIPDYIYQYAFVDLLDKHPEALKRVVYTVPFTAYHRKMLMDYPQYRQKVTERGFRSVQTGASQIANFLNTRISDNKLQTIMLNTSRPSLAILKSELLNMSVLKRGDLFPDGLIYAEREALRLDTKSLDYIHRYSNVIWTQTMEGISQISVFNIYPCKAGTRMDFDSHGSDHENLSTHILVALEQFVNMDKSLDGDLVLVFTYDTRIKLQDGDYFAGDIKWRESGFHGDIKSKLIGHYCPPQFKASL